MSTHTLPTFAPAITAVVNPAKTRTKVPNNSAAYFILTFTSGEFRCPNEQLSHAKILAILAANFTCKKQQRKCQREFYMAQSVLARIRTGAEEVQLVNPIHRWRDDVCLKARDSQANR
jgi:hypothetical protein